MGRISEKLTKPKKSRSLIAGGKRAKKVTKDAKHMR